MAVIALDLGGTKLAAAIFSGDGKVLGKRIIPLEGRHGRAVGELIRGEARALLQLAHARRTQVTAIGVSVPGISCARTGRVWAPNIPGWEDYPLRREIESVSGRRTKPLSRSPSARIDVVIESDRAAYILGETWRGAARGCRDAIFLAVGTGIGAGILADGRVLRGVRDIAGAIGWLALDRPFRPEYIPCGCFEYHASGEGLARVAKDALARDVRTSARKRGSASRLQGISALTARDIFAASARGDAVAKRIVAEAIEFWGMGVANLVSLFNPERIIFGGGVFGPATQFLEAIYAEAKKWAQPVAIGQVKLVPSKLGADAGLYGAGYLALHAPGRKAAR